MWHSASFFLQALVISLLLGTAFPAVAQEAPLKPEDRPIGIALIHSLSMPGGGWDWAEAVRTNGVRATVPVRGQTTAWLSAARAEIKNIACTGPLEKCTFSGTPWFLQGGIGYRFLTDRQSRLVPFVGAGAGIEWWSQGGKTWLPHLNGGVDWLVLPYVALRIEAQTEWQIPGRIAAGIDLLFP